MEWCLELGARQSTGLAPILGRIWAPKFGSRRFAPRTRPAIPLLAPQDLVHPLPRGHTHSDNDAEGRLSSGPHDLADFAMTYITRSARLTGVDYVA